VKKILLGCLLALGWGGCTKGGSVALIPPSNRQPAPEITANYINLPEPALSQLAGKVVLLDFWATWCGPCRMEIPTLVKLYNTYHSKGLEVVGLSVETNDNQSKEYFDKFIASFQINYPIGLANMTTLRSYGISPIPTTFFIDKSGKVALSFVGVHPEEDFTGAVEKLLGE